MNLVKTAIYRTFSYRDWIITSLKGAWTELYTSIYIPTNKIIINGINIRLPR